MSGPGSHETEGDSESSHGSSKPVAAKPLTTQSSFMLSPRNPNRPAVPLWLRIVYHLLSLAFTRYRVVVDVEPQPGAPPVEPLPDGEIPLRADLGGTVRIVPDKQAVHEMVRDWLYRKLNKSKSKVVASLDP